jgi:hypothetical protein
MANDQSVGLGEVLPVLIGIGNDHVPNEVVE